MKTRIQLSFVLFTTILFSGNLFGQANQQSFDWVEFKQVTVQSKL
jgi:hypothetical protein